VDVDLDGALWALEEGYCLWVGAGVSRHVAAKRAAVPLWEELTRELETEAGLGPGERRDLPSRLDCCRSAIGDKRFRHHLRRRYLTELAAAILLQANDHVGREEYVPAPVWALASLGQQANPIVSFNIEPLSSLLLARPAGPMRLCFQRQLDQPTPSWGEGSSRFRRLVYHPHGLVSGRSVMTASEYLANRTTLAFELAIHAAFASNLVIVGMSLADDYLRDQIERARSSLHEVYWFDSHFPERLEAWATRCRISRVQVDWARFWERWTALPVELSRADLCAGWYMAVELAAEEVSGGPLSDFGRTLSHRALPSDTIDVGKRFGEAGHRAGETELLIEGLDPHAVCRAVRGRLSGEGIEPPILQRHYG
jgi:hypothetical protein